ncbi:hypothetical protein, partial [Schlesneria sp.]|uniref:hypothetical protein n=1 Tax=Schlesneria sp. TaxID=2762018 RepID=UPI002F1DB7F6
HIRPEKSPAIPTDDVQENSHGHQASWVGGGAHGRVLAHPGRIATLNFQKNHNLTATGLLTTTGEAQVGGYPAWSGTLKIDGTLVFRRETDEA